MSNYHSFHIVDMSPWPLINSFNLMNLMCSFYTLLKYNLMVNLWILLMSFLFMVMSLLLWWRDTSREGFLQGNHTLNVLMGLKLGMVLFIVSEIMFFISFFWSFFHSSLSPEMEIGASWPPTSILSFNPFQIPLLNTTILLSSGVTVTWAHHSILEKKYNLFMYSLFFTIYLGLIFSMFQLIEYNLSLFSINDSIYGSIFFMATGFHGFHVMIGTIFLMVNLIRGFKCQFNKNHHFSFEAAAWYWHFVDVVWIYLYVFMYWWFY